MWSYIEERLGLRNRKSKYTAAALKNKQRAMHMQIEKQATMRRLTEINRHVTSLTPDPRAPRMMPMPPPLPREGSTWSFSRVAMESLGRLRSKKQAEKEEAV
jgi:hypothetical protein